MCRLPSYRSMLSLALSASEISSVRNRQRKRFAAGVG
jgi:hypothetical protein